MERSAIHLLRKRGKSLRAIAAELGHSKTTIARALSEPVDQPPSRRQRVSLVDPWRSQIAAWLRQGLSGVRMLEVAATMPSSRIAGVPRCGEQRCDVSGWYSSPEIWLIVAHKALQCRVLSRPQPNAIGHAR